jgi:hypothetical protein
MQTAPAGISKHLNAHQRRGKHREQKWQILLLKMLSRGFLIDIASDFFPQTS